MVLCIPLNSHCPKRDFIVRCAMNAGQIRCGAPANSETECWRGKQLGSPRVRSPLCLALASIGRSKLAPDTYRTKEKRLAALLKFAARPRRGEEARAGMRCPTTAGAHKVHGRDRLPHAEGLAPVRLSGSCAHPQPRKGA